MKTFLEIISYLKFIDSRKRSKSGFLSFIILILIIEIFVPPINRLPLYLLAIIFIIILIISSNIWLYVSGRWIFLTKKIKVGIALKSTDANTQKIIDKTFLMFNDELKNLRLLNKFYIFKIGTDVFNTIDSVEKYTNKWDVNLVIHGTVYSGKKDSKYRCEIKDPNFTYRFYNIPQDNYLQDLIKKDIQLMVSHREWIIEESNDLLDTKKVSQNLVEILLSLLSISLCRSYRHPEISIQLIKKVIPYLESHIPENKRKIEINKIKREIKLPLNLLRTGRLRSILSSCYINTGQILIEQKKYIEAHKILLDGLDNKTDKYYYYSALAFTSFFLKDLKNAELYTEKMNEIQKNTFLYFANKAFFSILINDYKRALDYYETARNKVKKENKGVVKDVITFLKARYKENPKELAYRYAIGLLIYNHYDKIEGKKILLKFYRKADRKIYPFMIEKIKFILKIKL